MSPGFKAVLFAIFIGLVGAIVLADLCGVLIK